MKDIPRGFKGSGHIPESCDFDQILTIEHNF